MPAGRPCKGEVDRLIALAQHSYLRQSLQIKDVALSKFLKRMPEGAMNDRDALRFLRHESSLSQKRAGLMDRYVPGIYRLSLLPWRELTPGPRDGKLIRQSAHKLKMAGRQPIGFGETLGRVPAPNFLAIANENEWAAVDDFFDKLISYRRDEDTTNTALLADRSSAVLRSFSQALSHVLFRDLSRELSFCVSRLLMSKNLVVSLGLVAHWRSLRRKKHVLCLDTTPPATLVP